MNWPILADASSKVWLCWLLRTSVQEIDLFCLIEPAFLPVLATWDICSGNQPVLHVEANVLAKTRGI
jgi:hypothetical protein